MNEMQYVCMESAQPLPDIQEPFICCLQAPHQPQQLPGLLSGFGLVPCTHRSRMPVCFGPSPVPEFRSLEKSQAGQSTCIAHHGVADRWSYGLR